MMRNRQALNLPEDAKYIAESEDVATRFMADDLHSMLPIYRALREKFKVPLLMFYGNMDARDGIPESTWLTQLLGNNYDGNKDIWRVDGRTVGYISQVLDDSDKDGKRKADVWVVYVNNAGHMIPQDQPKACQDLIRRFTQRGKKVQELGEA